jgi:ribosomal protein S11
MLGQNKRTTSVINTTEVKAGLLYLRHCIRDTLVVVSGTTPKLAFAISSGGCVFTIQQLYPWVFSGLSYIKPESHP